MKKLLTILFLFTALILPRFAQAAQPINLYLFYGDGCPHCAKEEKFLNQLIATDKNITLRKFEVWGNQKNANLLKQASQELNFKITGVPTLIIGTEEISGYLNDETTGVKIKALIERAEKDGCEDKMATLTGSLNQKNDCIHGCDKNNQECLHDCGCSADKVKATSTSILEEEIKIPFFGEKKIKEFSIPLLTVAIGTLDGFNPCAMWTLLFLISLLLGMKSRRRMWALGIVFIAGSAAVYFLFLTAWLNLFLFLGFVRWVRIAIGLVAIASGIFQLRDYWKNREGACKVTENEDRRKIFERIKGIVHKESFYLALGGMLILAFTVNLVELVCSAGLPALYTQVLALAKLPAWQYYGYILLYIFFYMIDDIIVFAIAMFTLRMTAISSKYGRWSSLIGGIIILALGLLLIFKPGWVMFG